MCFYQETVFFILDPKRVDDSFKKKSMDYFDLTEKEFNFSDGSLAINSIYGIDPLKQYEGVDLFAFLDQESNFDQKINFSYINVNDVVKFKGNSIQGPRREGIGSYNKKLFEDYSNQLENISATKTAVNLNFYNLIDLNSIDKILFSNFAKIFQFDGSDKIFLGEFLLVVFKKENEKMISSFDVSLNSTSRKFCHFKNRHADTFQSAKSKNKMCINSLDMEEFILLELNFNSIMAGCDAFDHFFKDSVVFKEKIIDFNDISNFM